MFNRKKNYVLLLIVMSLLLVLLLGGCDNLLDEDDASEAMTTGSVNIGGRIIYEDSKENVANASIELEPINSDYETKTTSTNENGEFAFSDVPAYSEWNLLISADDDLKYEESVVVEDESISVSIELSTTNAAFKVTATNQGSDVTAAYIAGTNEYVEITGHNEFRGLDETILYTPEWGDDTGTNEYGAEFAVDSNDIVVDIREPNTDPPLDIPSGGYVVSIQPAEDRPFIDDLEIGVTQIELEEDNGDNGYIGIPPGPDVNAAYIAGTDEYVEITGYNEFRGLDEIILYTPEWGDYTGTNEYGAEFAVSGNTVVDIREPNTDPPLDIPSDGYVVSIQPGEDRPFIDDLEIGVTQIELKEDNGDNGYIGVPPGPDVNAAYKVGTNDYVEITDYNELRTLNETILFTPDWGDDTGTNEYGAEFAVSGNTVVDIREPLTDPPLDIPSDGYVVSIQPQEDRPFIDDLVIGETEIELTTESPGNGDDPPPSDDYPSDIQNLLDNPPGTNIINLGDMGLEPGDNIIPYIDQYVNNNNRVIIPEGTYTYNDTRIISAQNASLIGDGEVVLQRGSQNAHRLDINTSGDFHVRNITLEGTMNANNVQAMTILATNSNATILVYNTNITDGSVNGDMTGIFVHRDHVGSVYFVDVNVAGFADNGLYASAPSSGEVHVYGGTYQNNNISNLRIGSPGSSIRNAVSIHDDLAPLGAKHGWARNQRGIWVWPSGGTQTIENTDLIQTVGWNPIIFRGGTSSSTVDNVKIYTESSSNAIQIGTGHSVSGGNLHFTGNGNHNISGSHSINPIYYPPEAEEPDLAP